MLWTNATLLNRLGLGSDCGAGKPILLTASTTDPESGHVFVLTSETKVDDKGNVSDLSVRLWHQQPYGASQESHLLSVKMAPVAGKRGAIEVDQAWIQSRKIFDRAENDSDTPATVRNVNGCVLEAVSRINSLLREGTPIEGKDHSEGLAQIIATCRLEQVAGKAVMTPGLSSDGGFDSKLAPYYTALAAKGVTKPFGFGPVSPELFKTIHGFQINTLDPGRHFDRDRVTLSSDPESGVEYESGVKIRTSGNKTTIRMYLRPDQTPEGTDPKGIPDLLKLEYQQNDDNSYTLKNALFLDEKVDIGNMLELQRVIGAAQTINGYFAKWQYPNFMDAIAKFNLLKKVKPLHTPPSLEKEGGEFLYVSLHGCGLEKKIENFGDQIGIGAMFMHRGLKKDGTLSEVGVLIDFPFASGGPDSNFDGAVPNYLPFWDRISHIFITHDHYDHKGGLKTYAEKGLLRDKIIVCTNRVKHMIDKDLATVPRNMRPRIVVQKEEGTCPIEDNEGNVRMWVQSCPNAVKHSALCTPYIVTGCYNDNFYKGSALIYGDSRGIEDKGINFFKTGSRTLPEQAKKWGRTVTPEKVDRDLLMVLHDGTAIRNDGESPEREEIESNLEVVFGWLEGKGIRFNPISTNNAEYTAALNVCHNKKRNVVGVGGNGEVRLSCMNLYGVLPDLDLGEITLDPVAENQKPEEERLIPQNILDLYFKALEDAGDVPDPSDKRATAEYEKNLQKLHQQNKRDFAATLAPDELSLVSSTGYYMLSKLTKHGAVTFKNDINGYFMCKAIFDRAQFASRRATRISNLGKGFRDDPGTHLIFTTGTQGNSQEQFSTTQKFAIGTSLLDVDENVRSTGYKINSDDYVGIHPQPGIVGNEAPQEAMINKLLRGRNSTEIVAFLNGFTVYNPKELKEKIVKDLQQRGWKHKVDRHGNITVYDHPIHFNGHGFRQDVRKTAKQIPAEFHELHHIADGQANDTLREVLAEDGLHNSGIDPEDFKVFRLDANQPIKADRYRVTDYLAPSYILLNEVKPYGQMYGGFMEWFVTTLLRREGKARDDGLNLRSSPQGIHQQKMAVTAWDDANPTRRRVDKGRNLGPSLADRHDQPQPPRSEAMLDMKPDAACLQLLKQWIANEKTTARSPA